MKIWTLLPIAFGFAYLAACSARKPAPSPAAEEAHAAPETNRIAIPSAVRNNLGLTFVKVERRAVERTLRMAGRFEATPTARQVLRSMLAGRIDLLVLPLDAVKAGTPLYRLSGPAWRELQAEVIEAEATLRSLRIDKETFDPLEAAHARHERSLEASVQLLKARVEQLEALRDAGGGRSEELSAARIALAEADAELANVQEKHVELQARHARTLSEIQREEALLHAHFEALAELTGLSTAALRAIPPASTDARPHWQTMEGLVVKAPTDGIVESIAITHGAWVEAKTDVLTLIDPRALRFRARALQSDAGALRDGLPARIVPRAPTMAGRAIPLDRVMAGTVRLDLRADPIALAQDLLVQPQELLAWAREGVAAELEVVTDPAATTELALPIAAIQRDGLTPVLFRRDPKDQDQAIRLEADLGPNDGRWVAVLSGLKEGDEVVLDGAFQLLLATSGTIQKGGHFHADGTFHAEDH